MRSNLTCLLTLASLLAFPAGARAWSSNPNVNDAVLSGVGSNVIGPMVPDGTGGMYVVWADSRTGNSDIYAQRFDVHGTPLWTASGINLTPVAGTQSGPAACSDGAGGLIVTWTDGRNSGTTGNDIYAQRLNASGVAQWTANGVVVCNTTLSQIDPRIVEDGAGGAIIGWSDPRTAGNGYDAYVARLSSAGTALWTVNGVAASTAANDQYVADLVSDGAGGAHILMHDYRANVASSDVYWTRRNASGALVGTANGTPVAFSAGDQFVRHAIEDGIGGVWVAIEDRSTNWDIHVARIQPSGNWSYLVVCNEGSQQRNPSLASDLLGGVYIAWNDTRVAGTNEIYAQRLSAAVVSQWALNGIQITTAAGAGFKNMVRALPDGTGGFVAFWDDSRLGQYGVFGQRVNSSGASQWASSGSLIAAGASGVLNHLIEADGRGGIIASFAQDRGLGTSYDLYLQRVDRYSYLGEGEPLIRRVRDVPNDQGGKVKLEWDASYLEADGYAVVTSYNIFRSAPAASALARGLALSASAEDAIREPSRVRYVSPAAGQNLAWEYITTVNGFDLPTYSLVTSTTGDSTGLGNPRTHFLVQARSGSRYWDSLPDSGYSVDNLAPLAPAPFTGQYAASGTRLHWNPNAEPDLAGYRLYRGTSASFVPSESNLVAALPDTGYTDTSGLPFIYKLTAVDRNGNESPVATLTPSGALDAPAVAAPSTLHLAAPWPSPARGEVSVAFRLPRSGVASLRLVDASGRVVRERALGVLAAGEHVVQLDLDSRDHGPLGAGVYFAVLEHGGERRVARVVTMR